MTCQPSWKASWASFQLARKTVSFHHQTRMFWKPTASSNDAAGESASKRGRASGSMLIHAHPPQSSIRHSWSRRSSGSMHSEVKPSAP
jgi:hypothetical protein